MDFSLVKRQDGDMWVDETGQQVPRKYVSAWQKLEERKVNAIYNLVKSAWQTLRHKKFEIKKHAEYLIKEYFKEHNIDSQKSFTFYNFNKSLMFEIDYDKELKDGVKKIYYRVRVKDPDTKKYVLLETSFSAINL
jgi:hypothetical protein